MRVLQVDSGREWRGGQNQVRLLCRELARVPDVSLQLVTRRGSELARRTADQGADVHGVSWAASLDPRALLGLSWHWRGFAPHVVHAHDSHALRLALWTRALLADRARVVATRRVDFPIRPRGPWHRVDRVIAISDAVRDVLVAGGFAREDIPVVRSGIDPSEVRQAAAVPSRMRSRLGLAGAPLAVNVAALVDHKDQHTLVRAAAAARQRRPDLHWVIAGDGPNRRALEAESRRLGIADRVHFVGYVAEADALIGEADVFVLSSREEGLGSVLLHALALGTPVVATAAGGIPEVVPRDALVPVGDADALAHAVVGALERPVRAPFPPQCSAAAMARGVVEVYRTLL